MPLLQRMILYGVNAMLLVLLGGVLAKRRYRSCFAFVPYVLVVWQSDLLLILWPDRFNRWDFWLFKEIALAALKVAIALEIGTRTLRRFPGARDTARVLVLLILAFTLGSTLAVPVRTPDYAVLAGELLARVLNGTAWLFTAIAAVVLWYRVPIDLFSKAIVMGFAPYLLVFTIALNALSVMGWRVNALSGYIHSGAYLALVSFWALAAWGFVLREDRRGDSAILALAEEGARRGA